MLTTNVIAESIYAKCDADGNEYSLLGSLVDYHKVITLSDQQTSVWGRPATCKPTADLQICCQRRDDSNSWEMLSNQKETHLVRTAKFAIAQWINHKPDFS